MTTKNWPWSNEGGLSICRILAHQEAIKQFDGRVHANGLSVTQILAQMSGVAEVFHMTTGHTVKEIGANWNDSWNALKYYQDAGRKNRLIILLNKEHVCPISSFRSQARHRRVQEDKLGFPRGIIGRGTVSEVAAILLALRNAGHQLPTGCRYITDSKSVDFRTKGDRYFLQVTKGKSRQEVQLNHERPGLLAMAKDTTFIPMIVIDL